jgi:hypothetical protein
MTEARAASTPGRELDAAPKAYRGPVDIVAYLVPLSIRAGFFSFILSRTKKEVAVVARES